MEYEQNKTDKMLALQLGVQQFSSDFCVYLKFLIIFKAGQLKEEKKRHKEKREGRLRSGCKLIFILR